MHTVSQSSMVEYAARARVRRPELVPVGIGNTIALCISSNRETMSQELHYIDGEEGWRTGGKDGAPFLLMKSLQHI